MANTPTSLTLKKLRKAGWLVAVVEKWNSHAKIRQDLFGFGDLLAVNPATKQTLMIQATTRPNCSARLKKAKALSSLYVWLESGNLFEVWGWALVIGKWDVSRFPVVAGDVKPFEMKIQAKRTRRVVKGLFDGVKEA